MNTEFNIAVVDSTIDGSTIQTFDGRQIHAALEAGQDYSAWVKGQITRARLVENKDYVIVPPDGDYSSAGRPRMNYHFTLDSAKNIGMMSGTDKGFAVRAYFIRCESEAQGRQKVVPVALTRMDLIQMALASEQALLVVQEQLEIAEPKVKALSLIADSDGSITVREAAKNLQGSPSKLTQYLRDKKWIYKQGETYLAFQARMTAGLLIHKVMLIETSCGTSRSTTQARVTHKGLTKLAIAFANE